MSHSFHLPGRLTGLFASVAAIAIVACTAGNAPPPGDGSSGAAGPNGGGGAGGAGAGPSDGGTGGDGGGLFVTSSGGGGEGEGGGPPINPCGTGCGEIELCDGVNKGIDDNCDGTVDEGCSCRPGQASSCFKGDPSYLNSETFPLCNPGTMHCTENLVWGPCEGGNHGTEEDACYDATAEGCHPINAPPFSPTDLSEGVGNFDDDADPGSEAYTVACPDGITPCPAPNGTEYTALQSGEYTVTYTKEVGGVEQQCSFPLYVGARGLRVELTWNFVGPGTAIDLDLHLHEPGTTTPWAMSGAPQDCGYANCTAGDYTSAFGDGPDWFPTGNVAPEPVNWYLDPVYEANTCYFAPRGAGQTWVNYNNGCNGPECGCHSPRLDLDNVSCNPTLTDPQNSSFCAPENINVDFPPNDQWMRIGVFRFPGTTTYTGAAYPTVKVFCDGALAAELGPTGFGDPPGPLALNAADNGKAWVVADVLFHEDECVRECIVEPIYLVGGDPGTPVVLTQAQWQASHGPPYPQIPQ